MNGQQRSLRTRFGGPPQMRAHAGRREIRGYAAVFYAGTPETEYRSPWGIERIMPGAFDGILARGDDVLALWNHDRNWVLGRTRSQTLRLHADDFGLHYSIDVGTSMGDQIAELVARGDVDGSSFSFSDAQSIDAPSPEGLRVRSIMSIGRVFDVGPVVLPAYEATTAEARSHDDDDLWSRLAAVRMENLR